MFACDGKKTLMTDFILPTHKAVLTIILMSQISEVVMCFCWTLDIFGRQSVLVSRWVKQSNQDNIDTFELVLFSSTLR